MPHAQNAALLVPVSALRQVPRIAEGRPGVLLRQPPRERGHPGIRAAATGRHHHGPKTEEAGTPGGGGRRRGVLPGHEGAAGRRGAHGLRVPRPRGGAPGGSPGIVRDDGRNRERPPAPLAVRRPAHLRRRDQEGGLRDVFGPGQTGARGRRHGRRAVLGGPRGNTGPPMRTDGPGRVLQGPVPQGAQRRPGVLGRGHRGGLQGELGAHGAR
mmetsp:Transcript_4296/g.9072  ORF Transcript_4296/g.9072 Transcript_4296/m.9072 type:complete len:212 (+) Transcript_4296:119-754(+)